ncbi:MAG: tRNA (guanine(46)-N(7))-methyltransferase TrmB [Rickettsiales bacterium]|nr:tRNA (guanine(46)-N(7))-methyltransferase TrmB [Rickettsiales bacterium]
MPTLDTRENIRSFGRLSGRALGPRGKFLLERVLPDYSVDLEKLPPRDETNYLEIGFGYGESLASRAGGDPTANYMGCEVYGRGIISLLELILVASIGNVGIFYGDARILLRQVEDKYFNGIFILFPDPWPKRKQHKKRIISEALIGLIGRKLKPGGRLFFASDSEEYAAATLALMRDAAIGTAPASLEECRAEPSWWIETRYQRKAKKSGRDSFFIEYSV